MKSRITRVQRKRVSTDAHSADTRLKASWQCFFSVHPSLDTPLMRRWVSSGAVVQAEYKGFTRYAVSGANAAQVGYIELTFADGLAPDAMLNLLQMASF